MYCLGFWGRMVCLTSVLYETLQVVEQVHWEWRVSDAPRPHHTSSDQLSGSRCCLSQEASPTASPEACVWVFSLRHVGALCVYDFFSKGQTRQIWLDTQGGPRNLSASRGSNLPNNQITQNDREDAGPLICEKTKGFDWWPLCCLCKASLTAKIHNM